MSIIRRNTMLEDYPFEALDEKVVSLLLCPIEGCTAQQRARIVGEFECFLQITNQSIDPSSLRDGKFSRVATEFIGALYSERFIESSLANRYTRVKVWKQVVANLSIHWSDVVIPVVRQSNSSLQPTEILVASFEGVKLNEEKVRYWRGWNWLNSKGASVELRLVKIYQKFGAEFTERLSEAFGKNLRNQVRVAGRLNYLFFEYLVDTSASCTVEKLQQPQFVGEFWRAFLKFFVDKSKKNDVSPRTASNQWASFIVFIKEHLTKSGLFAEPFVGLPRLPKKKYSGSKTNIRKNQDGTLVHEKLLTDIPLAVTDDQAIKIIFKNLEKDFNSILAWARVEADKTWAFHLNVNVLSKEGVVPERDAPTGRTNGNRELLSLDNPAYLANAAATFSKHGFQTGKDYNLSILYPKDRALIAKQLGLPTSGRLHPFLTILISEHPEITAGALERLELFNKSGKLVGIQQSDGRSILTIYKMRKGASSAEQIIHLTPVAMEMVQKIIAITDPARLYLKKNGDDNWRKFLLSTGKAFGWPRPVKLSEVKSSSQMLIFASLLRQHSNISEQRSILLAKRFTLTAVRATAGVLVYLRTQSVDAMASALGHTNYRHDLLDRYLPRAISDFFRDRWIRIFQNGIILHALKDGKNQFEASDFDDLESMNEFLANHTLPSFEAGNTESYSPQEKKSKSKVFIGVNEDVLKALYSCKGRIGTKKESLFDSWWSKLADLLEVNIADSVVDRPDLALVLKRAKKSFELCQ